MFCLKGIYLIFNGGTMKSIELKDKPLLSIKESAIFFGIGRTKLYELTNKDSDFVIYIGKKRMIKREEFNKYLLSQYSI